MVYLSTAYLGPIQQYCKMLQYGTIYLETQENFQKQTYRNRCIIAAANGLLPLTIPIVRPDTQKCQTKDIRISNHGNWRKHHWNALVSAYRMSPFFDYYEEDFAPFFDKKYDFLLDYNEALRETICNLIDFQPQVIRTSEYLSNVKHDFRESIRPKHEVDDADFRPVPYYQVFKEKYGFLPNLSIVDLLFNMGPESILILYDSIPSKKDLR